MKPLSRRHLALDRKVCAAVADSSGGVSYADILDNSSEAQRRVFLCLALRADTPSIDHSAPACLASANARAWLASELLCLRQPLFA
jgi:hypothetical protein